MNQYLKAFSILLGLIFAAVSVSYLITSGRLGFGAPQTVTTDTINTLRLNYNTLANEVGSSTRPVAIGSVLANYFPFWTTAGSSTLSASSTLFVSGLSLFTSGSFNASGTITQNGVAVTTGTLPTGANPTANIGLTAVNGTALTFLRSDGASALSQSIAPTWTGLHTFTATSTFTSQIRFTSSTASRCLRVNADQNIVSASGDCWDTAGRSLTLTGTTIDADAELYTHTATVIIINPSATVHSTGTVAIYFPNLATISSIACYSRPSGSSTIIEDRRVSSTPATAGDNILTSFDCTTTAAATTTIASSTMTANTLLNIKVNGTSGAPSSTIIHVIFSNND